MTGQQLSDDQRLNWLRLIKSENVGPISFYKLINRYGGALEALEALPEISRRGGLKRAIKIYSTERAERDVEHIATLGARLVARGEPDYPNLLQYTDDAPPLLCMKGIADVLDRPAVAIVGSRNASAAGRKLTRQFAVALGEAGYTVVSGLARGIDTAAHEAALKNGTVAVLASGLDIVYPPENETLHGDIGSSGLLISENMPGTRPRAEQFPRRNRIISGICLGTIVVEAAMRSGSLITARMAGEQGRELFALPGSPLDPRAEGTNRLIQNGAQLVTRAQDVINVLDEMRQNHARYARPTLSEPDWGPDSDHGQEDLPNSVREQIIMLLGPAPVPIDDLIRESGLPARIVVGVLLELELAGRVQHSGGQMVTLV